MTIEASDLVEDIREFIKDNKTQLDPDELEDLRRTALILLSIGKDGF